VISDAQLLKVVAASELDVDPFAFPQVIQILDEAGFVHSVQATGAKIESFSESVPYHESLYEILGQVWSERGPTVVERAAVSTVHRLSRGPVAAEELADAAEIESTAVAGVMDLGVATSLIKVVDTAEGKFLYSPFMAFEHPEAIADVLVSHGSDRLQEEIERLREYQGLPISGSEWPALSAAVQAGLIAAPSVRRPDLEFQAFACLPYSPDPQLFSSRKAILDKALAIVACVRCGQHFGGATAIQDPAAIIRRLLGSDHTLRAHSSARRQYQPLFRMQIVDFIPSGSWVQARLIDTEDNVAAATLALDLVSYGEALSNRAGEDDVRQLLQSGTAYHSPLRTMQRRAHIGLDDAQFEATITAMMGRAPL
jgi:hypothetical protein